MLEFGQLGVGLLDDDVYVGNTLLVFGNFTKVLGALFDLKNGLRVKLIRNLQKQNI